MARGVRARRRTRTATQGPFTFAADPRIADTQFAGSGTESDKAAARTLQILSRRKRIPTYVEQLGAGPSVSAPAFSGHGISGKMHINGGSV